MPDHGNAGRYAPDGDATGLLTFRLHPPRAGRKPSGAREAPCSHPLVGDRQAADAGCPARRQSPGHTSTSRPQQLPELNRAAPAASAKHSVRLRVENLDDGGAQVSDPDDRWHMSAQLLKARQNSLRFALSIPAATEQTTALPTCCMCTYRPMHDGPRFRSLTEPTVETIPPSIAERKQRRTMDMAFPRSSPIRRCRPDNKAIGRLSPESRRLALHHYLPFSSRVEWKPCPHCGCTTNGGLRRLSGLAGAQRISGSVLCTDPVLQRRAAQLVLRCDWVTRPPRCPGAIVPFYQFYLVGETIRSLIVAFAG